MQPLILVGTGRCGSTLLHRILSRHPEAAYLTPLCMRTPARPAANRRAMRAIGLAPWLTSAPGTRRLLAPSEAYPFWEHHCPGFSEPCRDLFAHDLRPEDARSVVGAVGAIRTRRRHRVLLKVTGWPRSGYLDAAFEDARFVHIRRDGRAVANSWLGVDWWGGWAGPGAWRWGELSGEQEERWRAADRSFVALAAINWEILMDAWDVARKDLPSDRQLDVTYEELCADPVGVLRRISDFASWPWTPSLQRQVAGVRIRDGNEAWRRQLTGEQQEVLQRTIEPALARHGYAS